MNLFVFFLIENALPLVFSLRKKTNNILIKVGSFQISYFKIKCLKQLLNSSKKTHQEQISVMNYLIYVDV